MSDYSSFSKCGRYKYYFVRHFDTEKPHPMCVFLLLNPSTHDAEVKNMTASRCESLAKHMYFNSMAIVNIFSLRSKTPEKLYYDPDPVGGAATDRMILWFADLARRSCEPGPIRPT